MTIEYENAIEKCIETVDKYAHNALIYDYYTEEQLKKLMEALEVLVRETNKILS